MEPSITPAAIFANTVSLLEAMCSLSSPTGARDGLEKAMAHYRQALESAGLRVETVHEAASARGEPMLLARPHATVLADGPVIGEHTDTESPSLMLIGHLDTVLPARPPRIEGDRLLGSGSSDMKGGMATMVGALRLLAARGQTPPADLLLVVVPDEEILGPYTHHAVQEFGGAARALWSLEPGKRREDLETVVIGRRGLFNWRLAATGRGAHAGGAYWQGRSALVAAADWCVKAAALSKAGEGPTVSPARVVAADRSYADDPTRDPALFGSRRLLNVVPDRALVEGEARFLAADDGPRLIAELEKLTHAANARHEVEMTFTVTNSVPPLVPNDRSRTLAQRVSKLAERYGVRMAVEEDRGGLSFPNLLPADARTIAIDGLGPAGGGMHTRDEWVDLVSLDRRITLLADLLATESTA